MRKTTATSNAEMAVAYINEDVSSADVAAMQP
jgi:hypothetical protein